MTVLNINLNWKRQYEFGSYDNPFYALTWSAHSQKVGSYIGHNAFNRSVRVLAYRNDNFYLGTSLSNLKEISEFKEGILDNSIDTSIFMPPNDARAAKVNMRALVIGQLALSPVFFNRGRDTPTIDDPYDRYDFSYALNIDVEEVWFYDYPTGNVLLKLSAKH